jgi:formylglycine-generating enzyme required for sulfatase activity
LKHITPLLFMKKMFLSYAALFSAALSMANNVQVGNLSLQNRNIALHTTEIHLNVSWDNSWRTTSLESNWDAAWIFVKYKVKGQTAWKHATLETSGHTGPATCNVDGVSDGKGVFVKAAGAMALSNVNYQDLGLKWRYGFDGLNDNDSAEICVYAIEMVYVPQGSFSAGDGNGTSFGSYTSLGATANAPYAITSENAISNLAGKDATGDIPLATGTTSPTIPTDFPKGFAGFYCMKYEVSQGQYVQFLNKLTSAQASPRAITTGFARNTVSGSWPAYSASAPHRAYNYMYSISACAYADWAGLRPMSELEYEKACRGPLTPVTNEFAWGDTTLINVAGVANDGLINETAANAANAEVNGSGLLGPLRTGWAGSLPATRANTGRTYYGIADMTGNVNEIVVRADASAGRTLNRADHGDGNLTAGGEHDVASWPGTGTGFTTRGGGWAANASDCHVSTRDGSSNAQSGYWDNGFRCVRTY